MARWYVEVSAKVGYPVTIVLGIPIYFLSKRKGWTRLADYALIGALLGIAAYFSIFLPGFLLGASGVTYALGATLAALPIAAICGAIAGISFWLIAKT